MSKIKTNIFVFIFMVITIIEQLKMVMVLRQKLNCSYANDGLNEIINAFSQFRLFICNMTFWMWIFFGFDKDFNLYFSRREREKKAIYKWILCCFTVIQICELNYQIRKKCAQKIPYPYPLCIYIDPLNVSSVLWVIDTCLIHRM